MRYKYCPHCKKAYVKSRLEKDNCMYCNQPSKTVDVKRNGLYYFGYSIMILGATSAFIPRYTEVSSSTFFIVMGIVLAFAGAAFVMMGSVKMAKAAAQVAMEDQED